MLNLFKYLEKTKGKPIPFEYKLLNDLPLTEDDLLYDGVINLSWSKITYLPDNLTVNGNLDLYKSKIKSLPNNLTVNSRLNINHTNVSELLDNLYVGGDLWCFYTPLGYKIKKDPSLLTKYQKQVKGRIFYE